MVMIEIRDKDGFRYGERRHVVSCVLVLKSHEEYAG
jgi:hypothetical protein